VAEPEPGLVVDGQALEIDLVDVIAKLDLNEAQILYDVAGVVQEDFAPPLPQASKAEHKAHEESVGRVIRNPAFKRAITCIAFMRKNPDSELETVLELVGKIGALDFSLALAGGDESPPETSSPSEPEKQKPSSEHSRSEVSGTLSTNGSDEPDSLPAATGTSESGTSSLGLVRST
jgi:hypothetical protein